MKFLVRLRRGLSAIPGLDILIQAVVNYVRHQSANQAASIAFSTLLAMFPLVLLLATLASYIGHPGDAAALVNRVLEYAPGAVREALRPVVDQVLRQRSQALLTIGLLGTVWTASSGMQAIRTALNKAYGVRQGLPFWKARIKVTIFTLIAGTAAVAVFGYVIVLPYVWQWIEQVDGPGPTLPWVLSVVRYGLAVLVLMGLYALLYGWLPDLHQRWHTVLPGAVVGALFWAGLAIALSHTLRGAGKLEIIYGSFAGIVATMIFIYACASTLIFGAEVNGVLRARHVAGMEGPPPPAPDDDD